MPTFIKIPELLVSTQNLTYILVAVSAIFLVFIGIAILKMYKLRSEEKKLMETNAFKEAEDKVKDYSGGHLYGDN
ncbi:MAG: hypothetical protein AAGI07_17055 [Bacteroidota bacterium]